MLHLGYQMRKRISYGARKLFQFFLLAICFLLPFQPKFLATVEILTVLFFLVGYSPKHVFTQLRNNTIVIPYLLFFLVTFISFFFSENKTEANRQLEVKLAFLVIPLLLLGSGIDKRIAKTGLVCFLTGCALACLILLTWSTYDYIRWGDANVFFYTDFSRFMHVSYFSMYLLICFGWFFMLALEDRLLFPRTHYFLMVLFAVCIFLISAKIVLVAFLLSTFLFTGYYVIRKKRIMPALGMMLAIVLCPVILYFTSPNLKPRINDFAKELVKQDTSANGQNLGSTGIRIAIWRDAVPQIKQHLPFGVGVGDVQTMLQENYQKRGMTAAFEKRFNMHNEYLQQLAGSGIFGFLLYGVIILATWFVCAPPYRFIGLLFSFALSLVSLTESILERQAGTIFICLIGILLMITYRKDTKPGSYS